MAIEFPSLQFKYAGKKYNFIAYIHDYEDSWSLNLDAANVEQFEYVNELNNLCPRASLTYVDTVGKLANYIQTQYNIVDVSFAELNTENDGLFYIEDEKENKKFKQEFLVTNVEILERSKAVIKYKLHLIHVNYLILSCPIEYSNYNKEKKTLAELIKICLMSNDSAGKLILTGDSFDENKDDIKIYYTTKEHDNAITAVKYLLSKYFYFDNKDTSMKFIYYNNMLESKCQYCLLDLNKAFEKVVETNLNGSEFDAVVLSMFKTKEENTFYAHECNIGTVVKFPKSLSYTNMFKKLNTTYSYNTNCLSTETIEADALAKYANARGDTFSKDNEDKFKAFSFRDTDTFNNTFKQITGFDDVNPKMQRSEVFWNNNSNIYLEFANELMNDNALIVHTDGLISRIPGSILQITIPLDPKDKESDDELLYLSKKQRYAQLAGLWIVSKVRHIVSPSRGEYSLNLVVFKNYKEKVETENDSYNNYVDIVNSTLTAIA